MFQTQSLLSYKVWDVSNLEELKSIMFRVKFINNILDKLTAFRFFVITCAEATKRTGIVWSVHSSSIVQVYWVDFSLSLLCFLNSYDKTPNGTFLSNFYFEISLKILKLFKSTNDLVLRKDLIYKNKSESRIW